VTDRQTYVVYADGPHNAGDVVHGRLADPGSTTFDPDGVSTSPLWAPVVFAVLMVAFVVQAVLLVIRLRRGRLNFRPAKRPGPAG
jgi:hypothetical protein